MTDCNPLIRPAIEEAFSSGVTIREDQGDCRVTFPIERSDGDAITVWVVERRNGNYKITDEGETYGMLYLSNINLDQERRKNRVQTVQERYGLQEAKEEISVVAHQDELGKRLLDVMQAIQSISHLTYTRRQYTQTDFRADVGSFLSDLGYHFDANPDVEGESETHRVDYSIYARETPTYLEALHAEDASSAKAMAQRTAYKWGDIKMKNQEVHQITVIDDESGEFGHDAERILRTWSDELVPWSQKEQLSDAITA